MNLKKQHNNMMIGVASKLNVVEFDDVKGSSTINKMWDELIIVHEEDQNVLRAKVESVRGNCDDITMCSEYLLLVKDMG